MGHSKTNRQPMRSTARSAWAYGFALLPVTITVVGRFTRNDETGLGPSLTLLILPVLVASWLGGRGPGFLATGLAGVAWVVMYVPQFGSIHIDVTNNLLRLGLFLIEGSLASWFVRRRQPECAPAEARLRLLAARDAASSQRGDQLLVFESVRGVRGSNKVAPFVEPARK